MSEPTMRQQYLAGTITHQDFYREVVKRAGVKATDTVLLEACRIALKEGDEHLNTVNRFTTNGGWRATNLSQWGALAARYEPDIRRALHSMGDSWSLAGGLCTMKQAYRDAATE